MAKGWRTNKKGRSKGGGQFIPVPYDLAKSAAFRSLNGAAVKVLFELRWRYNGRNNGDLSLCYNDAANLLGLSKSTVARAFRELEAKGFIFKTAPGHWYGRKATTWAVTTQKLDLPRPEIAPRNDWKRWDGTALQPDENSERGTPAERNAA